MIVVILLIISVLLGALVGKYLGKNTNFVKYLLILSAGFLIAVCVNEVFPQVYSADNHDIGFWVIGGVLLQMLLENITKGFEHGHFHSHSEEKYILPLGLLFGMFVHAFIEGIPLAGQKEISPYLLGIVFHNLPISCVLGSFLLRNKNKFFSWTIIIFFAIASPLGMVSGKEFPAYLEPYFLAIVGGIFLHISAVIIFESNQRHKMDWRKFLLVIAGAGLALVMHFFHKH